MLKLHNKSLYFVKGLIENVFFSNPQLLLYLTDIN